MDTLNRRLISVFFFFLRSVQGPNGGLTLATVIETKEATVLITDNELLGRYLNKKDSSAFEELVRRHSKLVMGVCQNMLFHRHDAEDAFQATFLILSRKASKLIHHGSVAGWLYQTAMRNCLQVRRRKGRARETEMIEEPVGSNEPWQTIADAQERDRIYQEINRLPKRYRDVIVLCHLEGHTRNEAAEFLDWTEAAVKAALARGRNLLRRRLIRSGLMTSVALATMGAATVNAQSAVTDHLIASALQHCQNITPTVSVGSSPQFVRTLSNQGILSMHSVTQTVMNARKELVEALAILDDSIMELVLSGEQPTANEMKRVIRAGTLAHQLTPVLMGSAYKNKGIQEVLDAATMYLPSPEEREVVANDNSKQKPNSNADPANDHVDKIQLSCESDEPAVAMAFKTVVEKFGQLTYLRVYQGQIEKGRSYVNARTQKSVRFGRLVRVHADQREEIERAMPGDIVGVIGVDCASGDTFTDSGCNLSLENITVAQPVLQLSIAPEKREDAAKLGKALDRFRKEDPTFQVTSDPKTGETLIAGMGQLHLDVYVQRIKDDYDCKCVVGQPRVAYKERPTATVEFEHTLKKMTGGPGQFAHIVGRLEVLAENSEVGFEFEDEIVGGRIERKFVSAVRAGVMESLERGPLGRFEVVEVKFTLIDGKQHEQDSSEIAFRQCAAEAMRNIVLPKSKIALLEPIMKLEIEVPSEFQGAVTGHLGRKRGLVTSSEVADGVCVIVAECPLAELFDYANSLRSMTQGNGNFSMEPCGYREVPKNVQDEVLADLEL